MTTGKTSLLGILTSMSYASSRCNYWYKDICSLRKLVDNRLGRLIDSCSKSFLAFLYESFCPIIGYGIALRNQLEGETWGSVRRSLTDQPVGHFFWREALSC